LLIKFKISVCEYFPLSPFVHKAKTSTLIQFFITDILILLLAFIVSCRLAISFGAANRTGFEGT